MSDVFVLDTSIFVDQLRTGRHTHRIQSLSGIVRTSAVVLSELWRGASSQADERLLRAIEKNHPVLIPTIKNWIESGQILGTIRKQKGFLPAKLRELHFDVLIALTARSCGARLITSNGADFQLIASYCPVRVEVWQ